MRAVEAKYNAQHRFELTCALLARGHFYFSDTLHVTRSVILEGFNSAFATHEPATLFVFPGGCDGLRFHAGTPDIAPSGDSGSAAFALIKDLSVTCKEPADGDIANLTGNPVPPQNATLYLRRYAGAPWAGVATAGTCASHAFETAGADPTVGDAFREFTDAGGAGMSSALGYPTTAAFDGTQYLVGDGATTLDQIISASAYSLQFIIEFDAASGHAGTIADWPAVRAFTASAISSSRPARHRISSS